MTMNDHRPAFAAVEIIKFMLVVTCCGAIVH